MLQSAEQSGRCIQVTFHQRNDRYGHEIVLVADGRVVPLLTSFEGSDAEFWPPSPPFQQLNIQEIDGRRVALLVGQAGKSHWSASIEVDSEKPQITFDIACRIDCPPERLLSSYRIADVTLTTTPTACRLSTGKATVGVESLSANDASPSQLITDDRTLTIACMQRKTKFPVTLRWQYRVTLE